MNAPGAWVEPWQAAALTARPVATVRDWARHLVVPACCELGSRRLLVFAPAVAERAAATHHRPNGRTYRRAGRRRPRISP